MQSSPDQDTSPNPPSFQGQLRLQDFAFTPSPPSPRPRRCSSRLSTNSAPRASPSNDPIAKAKSEAKADQHRPRRQRQVYAPPSTYAHLPHLPDALAPSLLVLFIGLNPGLQTARTGHAYAHPSNMFWKLLHRSGITPRLCHPTEDATMPALFALGHTNIVARPSRNGAELSKAEMDAGVEMLEDKIRRHRPEVACIVGKSIWESIWRVRHGKSIRPAEFRYGWQDESENMGTGQQKEEEEEEEDITEAPVDWKGARVFVATSTSGLAATPPIAEKERIWRELGDWVKTRREERGLDKSVSIE